MTIKSITARIITSLLAKTLDDFAWPLCRARFRGVMSPFTSVARFWERVGSAGEAIEAAVDRVAARNIDIGGHMMGRG